MHDYFSSKNKSCLKYVQKAFSAMSVTHVVGGSPRGAAFSSCKYLHSHERFSRSVYNKYPRPDIINNSPITSADGPLFCFQRTDSHLWGEWMGVLHGDEMQYVFGHPLNMSMPYNARERDLSIRIMEAFTRFSLTG